MRCLLIYAFLLALSLSLYENTSADNGVIIGLSANQASAVNHNYIKFAFSAGGDVNGVLACYGLKGT